MPDFNFFFFFRNIASRCSEIGASENARKEIRSEVANEIHFAAIYLPFISTGGNFYSRFFRLTFISLSLSPLPMQFFPSSLFPRSRCRNSKRSTMRDSPRSRRQRPPSLPRIWNPLADKKVRKRIEKSRASASVGSHISFEVGKPTFRVLTLPSGTQLSGKLFYSGAKAIPSPPLLSLSSRPIDSSRSLRRGCGMRTSMGG